MPAGGEVVDALERCRDQLTRARRLYVGFSGGLDSTVLLHAVQDRLSRPVIALHGHHGLHGDADTWRDHCAAWCAARGIEMRSRALAVVNAGRGVEAAAREARLAWFAEELGDGDLLLLAHHEDDQAETLMLRLLRGAGPDGLAAMPPWRRLGRGAILRPFLGLARETLAAYARSRDLAWISDPSNDDDRYDRNYLRLHVMPLLEARWPACRQTLARAVRLLREQNASPAPALPGRIASRVGDPGIALAELPAAPAPAAMALRAWLREEGLPMPSEARLGEFLRQLREGEGASLAWGGSLLTRFGDGIFLHPLLPPMVPYVRAAAIGEPLRIDGVGTVTLRHADALAVAGGAPGGTGHAPAADPAGELLLCSRRGGERLRRGARHRRLKKLLQEIRIPPWWRDRLPLLFERRDGATELVAVGPFAAAGRLAELGLALHWDAPVCAARRAANGTGDGIAAPRQD